MISLNFNPIGIIRSPYTNNAPYQPVDDDKGIFSIEINQEYTKGLHKLESFKYIFVVYHINKIKEKPSMLLSPPWADGTEVGVFASRSPNRPNNIGLSIVKIKKITENKIFTSGLDAFDKTPVLDIKPYIKELDTKQDANYGWIENMDDYEHLLLHIKGIPHGY